MGWVIVAILAIIVGLLEDLLPILGVIILLIIGYFLLKWLGKGLIKVGNESVNTVDLAKEGLRKRKEVRKKTLQLKNETIEVDESIKRLESLRKLKVDSGETKRLASLIMLLQDCAGASIPKDCLSAVKNNEDILEEIGNIEHQILNLAEKYKAIGDAQKCAYYLGFIARTNDKNQLAVIEKECKELVELREKENRAIKKVTTAITIVLSILVAICVVSYIADTPYREIETRLNNQTLTREMCDSDSDMYEHIDSEKGTKTIVKVLEKKYSQDAYYDTLWIITTLPSVINGQDAYASQDYLKWIEEHTLEEGTLLDNEGSSYEKVYQVKGYVVNIRSETSFGKTEIEYIKVRLDTDGKYSWHSFEGRSWRTGSSSIQLG